MLLLTLIAFPLPVEGTEGFHAIELVPFGEGVAATGEAGSRLLVLGGGLEPLLDITAGDLGIDWFRSIAADPLLGDLWVLAEDTGPFLFRFDRGTLTDADGFRFDDISNPVVDGSGRLWYSSGGRLFRDLADLGIVLDAGWLAVSADGETVAWVDGEDRVWRTRVSSDLEPEMVEERRSITPFYLPTSPVLVVPLLGGGFSMHLPEGSVIEVEEGLQPSWCPYPEGVVYCVSEDDGHRIIGSDLYLATLQGEIVRLTDTPDCLETNPSVFDEGIIAVDASNGYLVVVPDDCLFR